MHLIDDSPLVEEELLGVFLVSSQKLSVAPMRLSLGRTRFVCFSWRFLCSHGRSAIHFMSGSGCATTLAGLSVFRVTERVRATKLDRRGAYRKVVLYTGMRFSVPQIRTCSVGRLTAFVNWLLLWEQVKLRNEPRRLPTIFNASMRDFPIFLCHVCC